MKYELQGETLPVVICELEESESMITEKGAMAWMSLNMQMETNAGGIGKAFGRLFSGESIFRNIYTARGISGSRRCRFQAWPPAFFPIFQAAGNREEEREEA